jgi:hypothetical protein
MPDETYEVIEQARSQAGLSRSEFFAVAGLRYAAEITSPEVKLALDDYVRRTGDDGSDSDWTRYSRRTLANAGDEW